MKTKSFISIVLLLTICFCSMAQNKIALLEPRVGEGSISVTSMEKAMIRGELRKAIVNDGRYEAFTRVDIDQLMKEQDFQRTGMVNESNIKRLGEMSGADFLCVSTISKSNTEYYLEAYLINVETGNISNPASQYGALEDGKLKDMLPACQNLALELLGLSTNKATPTRAENTNKISQASTNTGESGVLYIAAPKMKMFKTYVRINGVSLGFIPSGYVAKIIVPVGTINIEYIDCFNNVSDSDIATIILRHITTNVSENQPSWYRMIAYGHFMKAANKNEITEMGERPIIEWKVK